MRRRNLFVAVVAIALLVFITLLAAPRLLFAEEADTERMEQPAAEQEPIDTAATSEEDAAIPNPAPEENGDLPVELPSPEEGNPEEEPAPAGAVFPPAENTPEEGPVTGGQPDHIPAVSIHDANETIGYSALGASLPAKFDSRAYGRVTKGRNQNPFGTCWAFATVAAVESSMLKRGQATDPNTLDLSERQLAYFTFNLEPDALGNTKGDKNIGTSQNEYGKFGNEVYLGNGGSAYIVSNVLASWIGLANEDALPTYAELVKSWNKYWDDAAAFHNATALAPSLARGANTWRLSQWRRIAMTDRTDVKKAIQNYGGLAVALYWDNRFCAFSYGETPYYNSNVEDTNHLVEIVGWDDNYSKDNFLNFAGARPSQNGAWLVKNSYGDMDYTTYSWVSYEDLALNMEDSNAFAFEVERASDYSNIYQYDGASGWCFNTVNSGGSIANVFKAKANSSGNEQLKAVSFSLSSVNVTYSIQVYGNLTNSNDPTSGTALLSKPITGKTSYAGYYTVPISGTVNIPEGSLFSVVVTLSHGDGSDVEYDVDATFGSRGRYSDRTSWIHFESSVSSGQSFERNTAKAAWRDLSSTVHDELDEPECAARIKAFTNNVGKFDISKATVSAVADQAYTGKAITPKPKVTLGGATLKEGTDYTLSYKNNTAVGTATITVTGKGNYKGTATKTFKIVAAPEPVADAVPVYRLYNKKTSEHLYTLNKNEYDQLPKITKGDWVQEGIAWYAPKTSKTPVYRLYNKRSGDHHYTTDQHERDTLVAKHGWTSEGIAFYSDDAKRLPLYRVYNSRLQRGQHHYTADANEKRVLTTQHGWVDENIGFYGVRAK